MEPPTPSRASPVTKLAKPDFPLLDVPVSRLIEPETPRVPASGVLSWIFPLEVSLLAPDIMITSPPVASSEVAPARIVTFPPVPESPVPT